MTEPFCEKALPKKKSKRIVRWYSLTPKAYRIGFAIEEYEKALEKYHKMSDKEIMELAKSKGVLEKQ